MGSGCGDPIVESVPSSIGQLPVPTALNAGSPTLFRNYYTVKHWKSKYLLSLGKRNCSLWYRRGSTQRLPLSGELSKIFDF